MRKSLEVTFARNDRDFGIQAALLGAFVIIVGLTIPVVAWASFFGVLQPEGLQFAISAIFVTLVVLVGFLIVCVGGVILWLGINDIRDANEELELLLATDA